MACGNDRQFRALCDLLDSAQLAGDPRFVTNESRVANRDDLTHALSVKTRAVGRDELIGLLQQAGVPAGPINTVAEAFADPQIQHRGLQITPAGVPGVRSPMQFANHELSLTRAAPKLGEHNAEVSAELLALEAAASN